MMICRKTMSECPTPGMCAPFQGCEPAPQPVQTGWKCPVCGTGNAPWASTCQNFMCGKSFTVTCAADKDPNVVDISSPVDQSHISSTNIDADIARFVDSELHDLVADVDSKVIVEGIKKGLSLAKKSIEQLDRERQIHPEDLNRPMSDFPE